MLSYCSPNCSRYKKEKASSHRSFFFLPPDLAETPSFKKLARSRQTCIHVASHPFADIPRPLSSPVPKKSVSTKLAAVIAKPIYHNRYKSARVLFQIHYTRVYNTKSLDKRGRTRIRVHVSLRKGERRREGEKEKERYGKRQKRGQPPILDI